ncbi:MAG: hypothetical protein CL675_09870 [Bdellovibrionaceae bacterium]|nr:hypothetical protein [Pseudobdellovibrionaceae bacterium]
MNVRTLIAFVFTSWLSTKAMAISTGCKFPEWNTTAAYTVVSAEYVPPLAIDKGSLEHILSDIYHLPTEFLSDFKFPDSQDQAAFVEHAPFANFLAADAYAGFPKHPYQTVADLTNPKHATQVQLNASYFYPRITKRKVPLDSIPLSQLSTAQRKVVDRYPVTIGDAIDKIRLAGFLQLHTNVIAHHKSVLEGLLQRAFEADADVVPRAGLISNLYSSEYLQLEVENTGERYTVTDKSMKLGFIDYDLIHTRLRAKVRHGDHVAVIQIRDDLEGHRGTGVYAVSTTGKTQVEDNIVRHRFHLTREDSSYAYGVLRKTRVIQIIVITERSGSPEVVEKVQFVLK